MERRFYFEETEPIRRLETRVTPDAVGSTEELSGSEEVSGAEEVCCAVSGAFGGRSAAPAGPGDADRFGDPFGETCLLLLEPRMLSASSTMACSISSNRRWKPSSAGDGGSIPLPAPSSGAFSFPFPPCCSSESESAVIGGACDSGDGILTADESEVCEGAA